MVESTRLQTPWEWRKALNTFDGLFHAYDINNHAACEEAWGLRESVEPVTLESVLCPKCWHYAAVHPEGREPINYEVIKLRGIIKRAVDGLIWRIEDGNYEVEWGAVADLIDEAKRKDD